MTHFNEKNADQDLLATKNNFALTVINETVIKERNVQK
jgi:hypothetical protein